MQTNGGMNWQRLTGIRECNAAGNSGETRQEEKSVQSLESRAMGAQSVEPHEINDTRLKAPK